MHTSFPAFGLAVILPSGLLAGPEPRHRLLSCHLQAHAGNGPEDRAHRQARYLGAMAGRRPSARTTPGTGSASQESDGPRRSRPPWAGRARRGPSRPRWTRRTSGRCPVSSAGAGAAVPGPGRSASGRCPSCDRAPPAIASGSSQPGIGRPVRCAATCQAPPRRSRRGRPRSARMTAVLEPVPCPRSCCLTASLLTIESRGKTPGPSSEDFPIFPAERALAGWPPGLAAERRLRVRRLARPAPRRSWRLSVRDREQHVGMTGIAGRAPAGEVTAGELRAGCGDEFGVLAEVLPVQAYRLVPAVISDRGGVAPLRGAGDGDRAGLLSPALGPAELDAAGSGHVRPGPGCALGSSMTTSSRLVAQGAIGHLGPRPGHRRWPEDYAASPGVSDTPGDDGAWGECLG